MHNGVILLGLIACALAAPQAGEPLAAVGRIDLPGVEGRFDHFTFDAATGRLFVAALGNNTVEVVEVHSGKRLASARGVDEPQGLAFVPPGRLIVANGGTGEVQLREGDDLHVAASLATAGDADNVRYDPVARRAYVGVGSGALVALDPSSAKKLGEVRLGAHPESFQLERAGRRIFVNVPNAHQIAVIDRQSMSVTTTWKLTDAAANYPMALDEDEKRLFVVCRSPARVLVYDTRSGTMTAAFEAVGDADDVFWDGRRKRLYVIGGQGFVDVFQRRSGESYARIAHMATGSGARTGLLVPDASRLFVAVPHRGAQTAGILMFETRD
jgi:DNA-binding beta-propeller fold protein YncE